MLSYKKSLHKIESLHERALRFLLNDYVSSYEQLLEKSGKCNINICRLRSLCIEIYKTLNDSNPSFMKEIFEKRDENRVTRDRHKLNLIFLGETQLLLVLKALNSTNQKF